MDTYHRDALAKFAETAREFCRVVDERDSLTPREFIVAVNDSLPLLYRDMHAVIESKTVDEEGHGQEDEARPSTGHQDDLRGWGGEEKFLEMAPLHRNNLYWEIHSSLEEKFGDNDLFSVIYHPYQPNSEAIRASLSDILSDIYVEAFSNLRVYDVGSAEAIETAAEHWDTFFYFWGKHCLEALTALHEEINQIRDQAEDE